MPAVEGAVREGDVMPRPASFTRAAPSRDRDDGQEVEVHVDDMVGPIIGNPPIVEGPGSAAASVPGPASSSRLQPDGRT
jgi:hypothetical protein